MEKFQSFLFALAITLLIASMYLSFNLKKDLRNLEEVKILRVIDGDTLITSDEITIRLLNINSPEKDSPLSNLSIVFLKSFEGKNIYLEKLSTDKYGRTLGRIYNDSDYLNEYIVKEGLASKFLVDESELELFNNAELKAVKEERGIWIHSNYFECISSSIDEKNEIIVLKNLCPDLNLSGFTIKDESRKIYTFTKNFSSINLHSSKGKDNQTDIFWNEAGSVLNNDRDTLYIFDKEGRIAHHESYGY